MLASPAVAIPARSKTTPIDAPAMSSRYQGSDVDISLSFGQDDYVANAAYRSPVFVGVASSALAAVAALTTLPSYAGTIPEADFSVSGFHGREGRSVIHEHMAAAHAEMRSYSSLTDGWDGEGSVAPDSASIDAALGFLSSLPSAVPPPEAGATADGDVEWYWESQRGIATVSFSRGRVAYYGRSGDASAQGSVAFDGRSIPSELLTILIRI